ncbi:MAG TPA: M1 family aminopeptidase [Oligoflexia bacterium]|nr:M1 family aminopeptidase [Oligoflexia bacterium]HMR23972.1 M1 family aminopeptidase [Oligoflexia bacterium]
MLKLVGNKLFLRCIMLFFVAVQVRYVSASPFLHNNTLSFLGKNFTSESNYTELRVRHYQLEMWIDPNQKTFKAQATLDFTALKNGSQVILDAELLKVNSLYVNDKKVDFAQKNISNTLNFMHEYSAGDTFSVSINYHIDYSVYEKEGKTNFKAKVKPGLWFVDPEDTQLEKGLAYTKFEPHLAARMFPCQNTPKVRTSFKSIIHTPSGMMAQATGDPVSQLHGDDQSTYIFQYNQSIPVYLYALIVGDFKQTQISVCSDQSCSVDLSVITENQEQLHASALRYTESAASYIEILSDQSFFAVPFPVNTMRLIFVPPGDDRRPFAAMENMGMIIFNESYAYSDSFYRKGTLPHELIHTWFGNMLTTENWQDLFVNEGPTAYFDNELLYEFFPNKLALIEREWQWQRHRVYQKEHIQKRDPVHGTLKLNSQGSENTIFDLPNGNDIYSKGAWLFKSVENAIEFAQTGHGKIGIRWVMSSILKKQNLPRSITLEEMINDIIAYTQIYASKHNFTLAEGFAQYIHMLAFEPGMPVISVLCEYDQNKNQTYVIVTQDATKLVHNAALPPSKAYPLGVMEIKTWSFKDGKNVQYQIITPNPQDMNTRFTFPGKVGALLDPKGKHFASIRRDPECLGPVEHFPIAEDDFRVNNIF